MSDPIRMYETPRIHANVICYDIISREVSEACAMKRDYAIMAVNDG